LMAREGVDRGEQRVDRRLQRIRVLFEGAGGLFGVAGDALERPASLVDLRSGVRGRVTSVIDDIGGGPEMIVGNKRLIPDLAQHFAEKAPALTDGVEERLPFLVGAGD